MTRDSRTGDLRCSRCGAAVVPESTTCWLCHADIATGGTTAATPRSHLPSADARPPERVGTYSLASLMMFMTLASVVCGAFTVAPGLGIALIVVAILACIRTVVLVRRQRALGHQPHAGERALLFVTSIGVVIVAGISAVIAAFGTCTVGFWAGGAAGGRWGKGDYPGLSWGMTVGLGLGGIVGLYVAIRVLTLLSRGRHKSLSRTQRIVALAFVAALVLAFIGVSLMTDWLWYRLLN